MFVPESFRKTLGFSALEVLLVLVIVIIICSSIYVVKYTHWVEGVFNKKTQQTSQTIAPRLVNIPVVAHNQIILSLTDAPLETSQANGDFLYAFGNQRKIATEWPVNAGFLVRKTENKFDLIGYRYVKTNKKFAVDGYDALQNLDTNSDGVLDSIDVDYENLYFWQDANHNGVIEASEIKKLTDLGIVAINLHTMQKVNEKVNSSVITRTLTFTKEDGSQGFLFDTNLFQNPYYREYLIKLPLDEDIKKLPNVIGTGAVRDLQEAATLNPYLLSLLIDYLVADATDRRFIRMDKLLFEWAKTSDYPSFTMRLESISTPHFDISLANISALKQYEDGVTQAQDLLRKIMIIENFNSKKLLYFFSQEVLNTSDQQWELHFTVSFGEQVLVNEVRPASQHGKTKVLLTPNMLHFTPIQIADIYSQYNQLKRVMFDRLQAKANAELTKQVINNQMQWLDLKLQTQIQTGEIYKERQARRSVDLPRRRHLIECIKPNNIIDEQVIDCSAGKLAKTW